MTVSADDLARALTDTAGGPDALHLDFAEALKRGGAANVIASSVLAALNSVAGSATARVLTAPPKRGRPPKRAAITKVASQAQDDGALATFAAAQSTRAPPLAYSIEDIVKLGLLGRYKIHALTKSGALKCRKVGRRTIILHEDLADYLKNCPVGPDRTITEKADVARGIREPSTLSTT